MTKTRVLLSSKFPLRSPCLLILGLLSLIPSRLSMDVPLRQHRFLSPSLKVSMKGYLGLEGLGLRSLQGTVCEVRLSSAMETTQNYKLTRPSSCVPTRLLFSELAHESPRPHNEAPAFPSHLGSQKSRPRKLLKVRLSLLA